MTGDCPTIELFVDGAVMFLTPDGRLLLDVEEGAAISLDKAIIVQDDALLIQRPETLALTLPLTPKNHLYLKDLYDPTTSKANGNFITCRITTGSDTLIYDKLYGVTKLDKYEVRFTYGEDWITKLKNLKLRELANPDLPGYLGTIDFTKDDVIDKWQNEAKYLDGGAGYWYPLAYYGKWLEQDYHMAVVEDLRPWVHSLWLMRKIFERIGWCIEFPFYETDFGRRLIDYLLRNDYGDKLSLRYRRSFAADKVYNPNTVWQLGGQIPGWDELNDPGNTFFPNSGEHRAVFQGKYRIRVQTTGSNTLLTIRLKLWKKKEIIGGATGSLIGEFTIPLFSTPQDNSFEFEVTMTPNESAYMTIDSGDLDFVIGPCLLKIHWYNEVQATYYQNGDIIPIASEIDQDLTAWDYMLGNIHFCAGIVTEKLHEKTIRILTPFAADVFGETIEGYFNNTLVKLTDKQPLNTTRSVIREQLRYLLVAFAESSDALGERLREESGLELFSKTYDLGEPLVDTEPLRNPIFEYTVSRLNNLITHLADISIAQGGFFLPHCLDNEDGEVSKDIGPRKIVAYGFGTQRTTGARIVFESELYSEIAYAAQESKNVEFNGAEPEQKLIYGSDEGDLWSMCIGEALVQFRQAIQLDSLMHLGVNDWANLDLRNLFEIDYDGHPVTGRILAVNDYRPCDLLAVQALLMPSLSAGNYCIETDPTTDCENSPTINQLNLGECWFFSITGDFDCSIESITWETKFDGEDWVNEGEMDTLEVCAPGQVFLVRATIVYSCNCPDSIIVITVAPCPTLLTCTLTPVLNQGQSCLAWDYDSDSPISGCEYEAILEIYHNGELEDTVELDLNELYCGLESDRLYILTFTLDCSESTNCEPLTTTCQWQSTGAPPQCDNAPILVCNPVEVDGVTCYEFLIEGIQQSLPETYLVTYTCNGVTGTWLPGDAPICCSGIIEAHAIVFYCDCPSICTETVQCEPSGCTIFNSGIWNPIAVCN